MILEKLVIKRHIVEHSSFYCYFTWIVYDQLSLKRTECKITQQLASRGNNNAQKGYDLPSEPVLWECPLELCRFPLE